MCKVTCDAGYVPKLDQASILTVAVRTAKEQRPLYPTKNPDGSCLDTYSSIFFILRLSSREQENPLFLVSAGDYERVCLCTAHLRLRESAARLRPYSFVSGHLSRI